MHREVPKVPVTLVLTLVSVEQAPNVQVEGNADAL